MKKKKEYFRFWTESGISCRIKIKDSISGKVLIQMKKEHDSSWLYYSPDRDFSNALDVSNYILKNLENSDMTFKVSPMKITTSLKKAVEVAEVAEVSKEKL